jgi:hypothetical protein
MNLLKQYLRQVHEKDAGKLVPHTVGFIFTLMFVLAIGIGDFLLGPEWVFSPFYIAAITAVVIRGSARSTALMAVVILGIWSGPDFWQLEDMNAAWWNLVSRGLFLVAQVYLLHNMLNALHAKSEELREERAKLPDYPVMVNGNLMPTAGLEGMQRLMRDIMFLSDSSAQRGCFDFRALAEVEDGNVKVHGVEALTFHGPDDPVFMKTQSRFYAFINERTV